MTISDNNFSIADIFQQTRARVLREVSESTTSVQAFIDRLNADDVLGAIFSMPRGQAKTLGLHPHGGTQLVLTVSILPSDVQRIKQRIENVIHENIGKTIARGVITSITPSKIPTAGISRRYLFVLTVEALHDAS